MKPSRSHRSTALPPTGCAPDICQSAAPRLPSFGVTTTRACSPCVTASTPCLIQPPRNVAAHTNCNGELRLGLPAPSEIRIPVQFQARHPSLLSHDMYLSTERHAGEHGYTVIEPDDSGKAQRISGFITSNTTHRRF